MPGHVRRERAELLQNVEHRWLPTTGDESPGIEVVGQQQVEHDQAAEAVRDRDERLRGVDATVARAVEHALADRR